MAATPLGVGGRGGKRKVPLLQFHNQLNFNFSATKRYMIGSVSVISFIFQSWVYCVRSSEVDCVGSLFQS